MRTPEDGSAVIRASLGGSQERLCATEAEDEDKDKMTKAAMVEMIVTLEKEKGALRSDLAYVTASLR